MEIHNKTLEDLEFPTIREQVAARCKTGPGKQLASALVPLPEGEELRVLLQQTSEYLASYSNDNKLPVAQFEPIYGELKLLRIENAVLEIEGFKNIKSICHTANEYKKFLKKFKTYYPELHNLAETVEANTEIGTEISEVIDRFGEVKDTASAALKDIRRTMGEVRAKINQGFTAALAACAASDLLDEIRESVVENRRVLAVKSMYRKRVKGMVMGSSKTGSIVYIEPEASLRYSRELNNLQYEEQKEIQRILKQLTAFIAPYRELLAQYQEFLAHMDLTGAKARHAHDINALLPKLNQERELYLRDAYHPLLYLSNSLKKQKTWPQTIALGPENRIIVISGPNAGGKSITLKTIGLLQLMLQSGLLVPVHERSSMCLFDVFLTDIGDNQSIENHLSTYSYRLKNMKRFLRQCNDRTLFLIDEFGTGSDPELGGALAETFLEVFYERKAYGVITTHYANLKLLANELPHATNANMQFNSQTLEPTFKLVLGEAGSSFTFEVAQKNGIPYNLINKAKKKLDRSKLRFDATIAKLQKERSKMVQTGSKLQEEEEKAREEAKRLEELNSRVKSKLENYQELFDHNQRMVHLGNKVNQVAERYFMDQKKRPLIGELLRIVETENSKRKKKTVQEAKEDRQKITATAQEMEQKIVKVRETKKKEKKRKEIQEQNKPRPILKVGDRVRLADGKAVGSIDSLEKNKAVVNYGLFTTQVSVEQLELVEAKK